MRHDHDGALEAFRLPPFESILPAAFRERFGLRPAQQYGIACRDVTGECRRAEGLGAGPFVGARVPAPGWIEDGQKRSCKIEFALGAAGEEQIEFLGPGEGTRFYADALQGAEHLLHHVGVYQTRSPEIEERLNQAGYPTAVKGGLRLGPLLAVEFRYFDTRDELGCYLEILDFEAAGMQLPVRAPTEAFARWLARFRRSD